MLERIKSPSDIKGLSYNKLKTLAGEIRSTILGTVSQNGGHLSSNLGDVELTIAIHRVFDVPRDKLIFDVGHQAYAHKLLTGRYGTFSTLRRFGGISGFTNRFESGYDAVTAGHSGAALSAAVGFAEANRLSNSDDYVIAVIGDGSFTNGMTFEALNNCSSDDLRLIIVLNDNEMSISRNVGGLSRHFARMRTSRSYYHFKHGAEDFLTHIPLVGKSLAAAAKKTKDFLKRVLIKNTLFDNLGVVYLGSVDGNDIVKVETVLREAKRTKKCCLINLNTVKGKGCDFAEKSPDKYHSIGKFDIRTGESSHSHSFSDEFGNIMCEKAENNDKLIAVTASMCDGTGLTDFAKEYPDRFFDVGIAEEHAAAFCGAMSLAGFLPVFAVYSTFVQRIYDQLWHDVAVQGAHIVLAIDRAGLVAGDGITHQGIFDIPLLTAIPGATVYSPDTYAELLQCFDRAVSDNGVAAVRYPKGPQNRYSARMFDGDMIKYTTDETTDLTVITYGRITDAVLRAAGVVACRISCKVVKAVKIFPIDIREYERLAAGSRYVCIIEESYVEGSIGQKIVSECDFGSAEAYIKAIDKFIPHGEFDAISDYAGTAPEKIVRDLFDFVESADEREQSGHTV